MFRPHWALRIVRVLQPVGLLPLATARHTTLGVVLVISTVLLLVAGEVLERIVVDEVGVTAPHRLWRRTRRWSEIHALGAVRGDDRLTMILEDGTRHRLRWVPTSAYQRIPQEWLVPASDREKAPALPEA